MRVILLLAILTLSTDLLAQAGRDSVYRSPFDTNRISQAYYLSSGSTIINYRDYYLWSDKRNLSEILNERAGYFINRFSPGGRNVINYNNRSEKQIAIFKDGIQVNDNFFGGFDIENISINEIDKIEEISNISSFLYGYNAQGKSINIITKDVFQPKPFSQLRYSQDRHGSLFADAFFSLPLSKRVSIQLGANNHTLDGLYSNSDFNVWRGRARANFYLSPKLNIRFNINYTKIQRGLFEGLINQNNKDSLFDEGAAVVNPDSYEKITNFFYDASLTARLFRERSSLTILKASSFNSIREYRDEEDRPNPQNRFVTNNFHTVQYNIDLRQNVFVPITKKIGFDLMAGGNAFLNFFNYTNVYPSTDSVNVGNDVTAYKKNYYAFISKADLNIAPVKVSAFYKSELADEKNFSFYGIEASADVFNANDITFSVTGGYKNQPEGINYLNSIYNIDPMYSEETSTGYEIGGKLSMKYLDLEFSQFKEGDSDILSNGTYSLNFFTKHIDGYVNANRSDALGFPDWYLKADVSYHNFFFKNKLNFRAGFNFKYIHELTPLTYSQYTYMPEGISSVSLENMVNVDFYIGARIGSANVNLTLANIFNTLFYDTYLFPYDDRGGALSSISRFTIVWDFLD